MCFWRATGYRVISLSLEVGGTLFGVDMFLKEKRKGGAGKLAVNFVPDAAAPVLYRAATALCDRNNHRAAKKGNKSSKYKKKKK